MFIIKVNKLYLHIPLRLYVYNILTFYIGFFIILNIFECNNFECNNFEFCIIILEIKYL
jgi:hypothetical protein